MIKENIYGDYTMIVTALLPYGPAVDSAVQALKFQVGPLPCHTPAGDRMPRMNTQHLSQHASLSRHPASTSTLGPLPCQVWHGMARHSFAWHGTTWHGTAGPGLSQHGVQDQRTCTWIHRSDFNTIPAKSFSNPVQPYCSHVQCFLS